MKWVEQKAKEEKLKKEEEERRKQEAADNAARNAAMNAAAAEVLGEEDDASAKETVETTPEPKADAEPNPDDLLADFFGDIEAVSGTTKVQTVEEQAEKKRAKEANKDLGVLNLTWSCKTPSLTCTVYAMSVGTADDVIGKVLCKNFEWHNLNPFVVLQLEDSWEEATSEFIKQRYYKVTLATDSAALSHWLPLCFCSYLKWYTQTSANMRMPRKLSMVSETGS